MTPTIPALLGHATQAIDAGADDAAIGLLGAILNAEPNHAGATWQVGRFFGRKEAYAEAAAQFMRAVQLDPSLSRVEFSLGGRSLQLEDVPGSTAPAIVLREFSKGMYDLRTRAFSPGDVVLDIGAHIGGVSIVLAALHPELRIYAYEPARHTHEMLLRNLAANAITNVVAVKAAVAAAEGTMELMWLPRATCEATTSLSAEVRDARERAGWQREQVRCLPLDAVLDAHGIERCALMKLDCEGGEWDILKNAPALERIDAIALELHVPASRLAEPDWATRELEARLQRVTRRPRVQIYSMVQVVDS